MKITIIGFGVVGKALLYGFKKLGHDCLTIDKNNLSDFKKVINSEIVFLTLPTPLKKNQLDQSIIEIYLKKLSKINFKGLVVIKSTVLPGSTDKYIKIFKNLNICYVPEFLRERCAKKDFVENHDLLLIGTKSKKNFKLIKAVHGKYPKKIIQTNIINTEFIKFYSNIYNAIRVTFANSFYDVVKKTNGNYNEILKTYLLLNKSSGNYLKSSENLRGFAGACLPKDLSSFIEFAKNKKVNSIFFKSANKYNNAIKKTVFKNMRK